MRGYNERDSSEFSLASLASRSRGSTRLNTRNEILYTSRMSELLPPRPLVRLLFEGGSYSSELASTAATIRGRLLFGVRHNYSSKYGTYILYVSSLAMHTCYYTVHNMYQ